MKNLNILKWFVLVFVLVGVAAIFWLLTEDFDRDLQFYIALICLLLSIIVSTYTINMDMLFMASKMNDFPHRVAFMTLSFIYEALVIISIIGFYMIKRLDVNVFASIMIGWLILFVILTYALLMLNRFVSSNEASTRSFSIKKGQLNEMLTTLKFACDQNPAINGTSPVAKKVDALAEKVRFSDPISRDEVQTLDQQIVEKIQALNNELPHIQNDDEQLQLVRQISEIEHLIEQRNQALKTLK